MPSEETAMRYIEMAWEVREAIEQHCSDATSVLAWFEHAIDLTYLAECAIEEGLFTRPAEREPGRAKSKGPAVSPV